MRHLLKDTVRLFALAAAMSAPSFAGAQETTQLAEWTFDKPYDVTTVDGKNIYTPKEEGDAEQVRVWFNQGGAPYIKPNQQVDADGEYLMTAFSKDRYWEFTEGYKVKVFRIENYIENAITDYTDASQHNVYYEASFPTTGYKNISIKYTMAYGGNAEAPIEAVVSTDGGNTWFDAGSTTTSAAWWQYKENTVALSANNKENVKVRLIATNGLKSNYTW